MKIYNIMHRNLQNNFGGAIPPLAKAKGLLAILG
jgi:hypothetical protein